MPLFEIHLQFTVLGTEPNDQVAYFLNLAPYMWKDLCKDRIDYTVIDCKQPTETDLVLLLDIKPRYVDSSVSDEEMRGVGIRNPSVTRAATDLYYWVQSLRLYKGPVYTAWRLFCEQYGSDETPAPVMLLMHTYREALPAFIDTPVKFPSPTTIDSPLQLDITDFYDE